MEPSPWSENAKCRGLSSALSDDIFWPGSGGKPTKAKEYCNDCPVISLCLREAMEKGLTGFWAGTTDRERMLMAETFGITPQPINLNAYVFGNPTEGSQPKKVKPKPSADTLTYLDSIDNPMYYT